jgi:hypothetical protein
MKYRCEVCGAFKSYKYGFSLYQPCTKCNNKFYNQIIHKDINRMKWNLLEKDFMIKIEQIVKYKELI